MQIIQNIENTIFFSQISLFEIAIKQKIGKLPAFSATIEDVYHQALSDGFTFLPLQNQHLYNYKRIPLDETHRDPFDRAMLAAAFTEGAVILSADEKLRLYNDMVSIVW